MGRCMSGEPRVRENGGGEMHSSPETTRRDADCVVIISDHSTFDYDALVREARLIIDTRNALKGFSSPNIVRL